MTSNPLPTAPVRRDKGLIVAIDGPSGAGKSTVGRALAEALGYTYLDTGAMYRALALRALERKIPLDDEQALAEAAASALIGFDEAGTIEVTCEKCGKQTEFPAAQFGSVKNCPHCNAFVDVGNDNEIEGWDAVPGEEQQEG